MSNLNSLPYPPYGTSYACREGDHGRCHPAGTVQDLWCVCKCHEDWD